MSAEPYDHKHRSHLTVKGAERLIGKRATLPLTGTIEEFRETDAGVAVVFGVDERWGLAARIVIDVEALVVEP